MLAAVLTMRSPISNRRDEQSKGAPEPAAEKLDDVSVRITVRVADAAAAGARWTPVATRGRRGGSGIQRGMVGALLGIGPVDRAFELGFLHVR